MEVKLNFNVLTGKEISELLDDKYLTIEDVVKRTYIEHHNGKAINPDSYFLRFPDEPQNRIIALPAALTGEHSVSGIKWISSFPNNIKDNLPRASAVLVLNDSISGYPICCMEGSIISASRTASSAVLGAYELNSKKRKIETLGIIGTGLIAGKIIQTFYHTGWDISNVLVYDQEYQYAHNFKEKYTYYPITVCSSIEEAITRSDILTLATTSSTPYINDVALFSHNPIVLNISLRDLSEDVILAGYNVVDDTSHCLKASTSPHLASIKVGNNDFIYAEIAEILQNIKSAPHRNKPIIYSPFGMGILDLALGFYLYNEAQSNGQLNLIDNFFSQLERY